MKIKNTCTMTFCNHRWLIINKSIFTGNKIGKQDLLDFISFGYDDEYL